MKTYNVSVSRDAPNWVAELEYKGSMVINATTWPALVDLVDKVLHDKGAGELDEEYKLTFTFADQELESRVRDFHEARREARSANEKMEQTLRAAARSLVGASSTRDAGAVLGYSHQYISKITQGKR